MKNFEYFKVTSIAEASSILNKYKEKAKIYAGGSDLLNIMKDGLRGPKFDSPEFLVDIKNIPKMDYIREEKGIIKIGALTTLSSIESSSLIKDKVSILSEAAKNVAVPQIRNVATIGGNINQRPRCWYFRGKVFDDCFKKGGNRCYAVNGENVYNAIIGGGPCYIVHPSDTAIALVALGAKVKIVGLKNRTVELEKIFVLPKKDVLRENELTSNEIITEIQVPVKPNTKGVFIKFKERGSFDFAMVSVAGVFKVKNGVCENASIVLGGVAPIPWRAKKAEEIMKGKKISESLIREAGNAAVDGSAPLSQNVYKVEVTKGLLEQAIRSLG